MLGRILIIGFAGLLALAPVSIQAQNVHTSRLYEQILQNIEFANSGHVLDSFGIVRMNQGGTARVSLDVPVGVPVQIMGDCDEDCLDLDLIVFNGEGKIIGEDRMNDFYPIVDFDGTENGHVEIELDLVDCTARYCYAAYSVFIDEQ